MSGIGDLLNPINGIADLANSILGKFVADPKEKADAALALVTAQNAAQSAVLDFQKTMAEAQSRVIVAEASSQSWLTSNWRPLLMTVFMAIIVQDYIVVPIFKLPPATIPDQMWTLIQVSVSGYVGGRTVEKVAPAIIAAFKK